MFSRLSSVLFLGFFCLTLVSCAPTDTIVKPLTPITAPVDEVIQEIVKEKQITTGGVTSTISVADEKQVRIPF